MADRFDLDAIEADDVLLDLLAAGGGSAWEAGGHDPALKLLADLRLAVEVEDELPVETIDDPESFLARCAALNPVSDPFARKLAARGLALGVAAVAALSVSGVAAAVTGDPLSPYEKVIQKVVDGLRDEASFPKEQLDGMPVVDKTKIVKVGKNYKEAREAEAREQAKDPVGSADNQEASLDGTLQPPLALPVMQTEKQLQIEVKITPPVAPVVPEEKPAEPVPTEQPTVPTEQQTEQPTTPVEPTDPPTTTEPTEPPSTTTPPPTEETTEPAAPPSSQPTDTGSGDNGSTGSPGDDTPVTEPVQPTTQPTAVPTTVPDTGGETGTGSENNPAGDDQTSPADQTSPGDQSGDQDGDKPLEPIQSVIIPVLPTPTGAPIEAPARLQEYFGKGFTGNGKHSSGKPALGWAKSHYAKGKHASAVPAEGKHAAIARAHGSIAPVTVKQILGLLNTPMTDG
jgi:hypothetical protein